MFILRLSQPVADEFLNPAPPGTPLPENQETEVADLRSACIAFMRFGYIHHLRHYRGEVFDESRHLVGSFSTNGCLWEDAEHWEPGSIALYDPSGDEWREARGLPPETEEERVATEARIAEIQEEAGWPKPGPVAIGQAVLLFTTPAPKNAIRATVLDVRKNPASESGVQYQTKSAENTRWDSEDWVHARLQDPGAPVEFSRQVSATLRAEFAAIPVGSTGKTLGQIVSEALTQNARTWKFADYMKYDQDTRRLLDEMVEVAALAAANV